MADIADCLSCRKAGATFKLLPIDGLAQRLTRRDMLDFHTHSVFGCEYVSELYAPATLGLAGPRALAESHFMHLNLASTACEARARRIANASDAGADIVDGCMHSQRALHRHLLASSRLGIGSQPESALVSRDSAFSDTDRQVACVTCNRSCGEMKRVWRKPRAFETLTDTSQGLVVQEQKAVVPTARRNLTGNHN
jgi:hypothetical protein